MPTVPEPKAVLVLSTLDRANVPQVISFDAIVDADIDFEYGEFGSINGERTESVHSCGATLNGEFWVFGGRDFPRQVKSIRLKLDHVARGSIDHI